MRSILTRTVFALAASLAGTGTALAADCYEVTGWSGTGSIGDYAYVAPVSCSFNSPGYVWFQVYLYYGTPWPDDLWVVVPPTDPHLSGTTFDPLMVVAGPDGSGLPLIYLEVIVSTGGDSEMDGQTNPPDHCWQDVSWYDGSIIDAWWDTANCYVAPVPAGQTAFVYANNYYITPQSVCPVGTVSGSYCYVMSTVSGSFVASNRFYDPPYAMTRDGRGLCRRGRWDGVGCYLGAADPDTTAFVGRGGFYTTQQPLCAAGSYDTANCYMGSAPADTTAFVWSGSYYYAE